MPRVRSISAMPHPSVVCDANTPRLPGPITISCKTRHISRAWYGPTDGLPSEEMLRCFKKFSVEPIAILTVGSEADGCSHVRTGSSRHHDRQQKELLHQRRLHRAFRQRSL